MDGISGPPRGTDCGVWKAAVRYLISGLLVLFVMVRVDWSAIGPAMAALGAQAWAVALALYLAAQMISGYRWAGLSDTLGLRAPLRQFVAFYFEGMFFNLGLPGAMGGDLVKACRLGDGTARRVLAGCSVLAERLCGLVALIGLAALGIGYQRYHWTAWQTALVAVALVGGGAAGWFALARRAGRCWAGGSSGSPSRSGVLGALTTGLRLYRDHPAALARGVALGLVIQLLNIAMFVLLGRAMGIGAPVAVYFVVVPSVSLATALPLSVGGIGLREAGFAALLSGYGVDAAHGTALGLAGSSIMAAGAVVGGLVHLRLIGRPVGRATSEPAAPVAARRPHARADQPAARAAAASGRAASAAAARSMERPAVPGFGRDGVTDAMPSSTSTSHAKGFPAMNISVVIPIYNEQDNIEPLYDGLHRVLSRLDRTYEIIFVDDGSRDASAERLRALAGRDRRVRVIRFRRNYGQTAAMLAGLQAASGDAVVTIDGDLQNDPADIPMMLAKLDEGYDLVHGWRKDRQDPLINRRIPSKIANWLIARVTKFPVHDLGCTLKVMRRETAHQLRLYGEMHRFIPILAHWQGARCAEVVTAHHPRRFGETKYGIWRTFRVLLDLITVKYFVHYSPSPMQLFGGIGFLSLAGGMLSGAATVAMKVFGRIDMTGNPLLLLAVFAMTVGVQFLVLGLLGEICSRIYYEALDKRLFAIREQWNFPADAPVGAEEGDEDAAGPRSYGAAA